MSQFDDNKKHEESFSVMPRSRSEGAKNRSSEQKPLSRKERFLSFMRKHTDPAWRRKKKLPSPSAYPPGEVPLWVSDPEHYEKKRSRGARFWRGFGVVALHFLLIAGMLGVTALGVAAAVVYSFSDTDLDERFASMDLDYSSFIYATNQTTGENYVYQEIQSTSGTRVWVSGSEIPKCVLDATVAIEDKRFYQHIGVDPMTTAKATVRYLYAKLLRRNTSDIAGGSTLTQQVIKNMTGDQDHSSLRKVKEMLRALYIERRYTKDQILEYYLNTVYFGQNAYGISAAADIYFGKTPAELTVVEAAAIVGITKSPTYFNPVLYPEYNRERRNLVLWNMYDQGYITEEEYQEYIHTDLVLAVQTKEDETSESQDNQFLYNYYSDMVISDVLRDLQTEKGLSVTEARNLLYRGGLQIYACVDPDIQSLLESYFGDEKNFVYKNSSKDEIVVDEETGKTEVPQTAFMLLDPDTGDILGLVGGRGEKTESRSLNRCETLRQPGSSIKPLSIYGYAIEHDILTEGSAIDDSPVITSKDGKTVWPSNYDGTYTGLVSVKKALSWSLNAPAARALQMVGISNSYDFLVNNLHFSTLTDADRESLAPLAVGALTKGVSLREMVTGYTIFAGQGMYAKSRSYSRVVSYDGKVVLDNAPERENVFSEQTSYIITDILGAAVTVGSSAAANLKSIATAGKSGTTSYFKDRWFIGYTPYYLGGIWWGYDTPNTLENTHHVQMWHDVMLKVHQLKGISEGSFSRPSGIVSSSACWKSGELPGEFCSSDQQGSSVQTFLYKEGTQPTKRCSVHHQLYVCTQSGKIAHTGCPTATLKTFVDIQRSFNCTVRVKDAGYICPRLSPKDILYISDTMPVYTQMVPEGEFPSIVRSGVAANAICTVHAPGATPHPYTVAAPVTTDTSQGGSSSGAETTDRTTNTDVNSSGATDTSSSSVTDVSSPSVTDSETSHSSSGSASENNGETVVNNTPAAGE